jgi:hypothetical protein
MRVLASPERLSVECRACLQNNRIDARGGRAPCRALALRSRRSRFGGDRSSAHRAACVRLVLRGASVVNGVKIAIEISNAQHTNMIPLDLPSEGSYSITRLLQMRIRCLSCPQHHPASA